MGRLPQFLLIDDCLDTAFLFKTALAPYRVVHVTTLAAAWAALKTSVFDLLIIDVELPDGDGFKFCSELNDTPAFRAIPKIMVSARASTEDKIFGLNCGADDYITKPFNCAELKARAEARIRNGPSLEAQYTYSCFEFHTGLSRCVVISEAGPTDLQLTPTEFRIFFALVRNHGTTLSRRDLVEQIWEASGLHIEDRVIDSHIAHLRKKLGDRNDIISSVYGQGYLVTLKNLDSKAA